MCSGTRFTRESRAVAVQRATPRQPPPRCPPCLRESCASLSGHAPSKKKSRIADAGSPRVRAPLVPLPSRGRGSQRPLSHTCAVMLLWQLCLSDNLRTHDRGLERESGVSSGGQSSATNHRLSHRVDCHAGADRRTARHWVGKNAIGRAQRALV